MRARHLFLTVLCAGAILSGGIFAKAAGPAPRDVHVDVTHNDIIVDGVCVVFLNEQGETCDPMLYQGTFYLPLRTAGEWMGAEVRWDQETMTAFLETGGEPVFHDETDPAGRAPLTDPADIAAHRDRLENGVTARLSPDITVVLDGVEQRFVNAGGAPVYPLSLEGSIYLPVRSIGQLCGKQVLWHPYPDRSKPILDRVYLYDPLTQAQLAAGQAYLARCDELLAELVAQKDEIKAARDWDEAAYQAKAAAMKATAEELAGLAWPDIPILQTGCKGTKGLAGDLVERYIVYQLDPDTYLWPEAAGGPWQERRDLFVERLEQFGLRELEERIAANHRLLEAVILNAG